MFAGRRGGRLMRAKLEGAVIIGLSGRLQAQVEVEVEVAGEHLD